MPNSFVFDDSKYYQNMARFVDYINSTKNYSDKLVERFQQFYSSATIESLFCGVRFKLVINFFMIDVSYWAG